MVMARAQDAADGRGAIMVAYHRGSVEALNRAARAVWAKLGRLSGPELEAPGGRRFRAGDRVVTLAPGPDGAWVTSQVAKRLRLGSPRARNSSRLHRALCVHISVRPF